LSSCLPHSKLPSEREFRYGIGDATGTYNDKHEEAG
jgi:hypothetical protein